MAERYSFVVVANRLPVDARADPADGERWSISPGGLVSALHPIVRRARGAWLGAAMNDDIDEPFTFDEMRLVPLALSAQEVDEYYEGQSNATIWPLFHDAVEQPVFEPRWRRAYEAVNRRFAEAAAALAAEGATVWIHDYQLMLVPAMLRDLRPDLRIGFFLHIPFPPIELFMQMPSRREIVRGLLGADLIGFQRPLAAENFLQLTRRLLDLAPVGDHAVYQRRTVVARAFPISIDAAEIAGRAADPRVRKRAEDLRRELGSRRILLGVDRLDYTKGIVHRLSAFHALLHDRAVTNDDVVLLQLAIPSRQRVAQYQRLRKRVEVEVGRITGEFSAVGRGPVHYLFQAVERDELIAMYLAADVMLVTPLRDGMNLVAKEFVATRADLTGSLVLSEFTGAAEELIDAFLVNPHDIEDLKIRMLGALHVHPAELRGRMRRMRAHVLENDVDRWAHDFLDALAAVAEPA